MYLRISKEDGSVRISAPHQMSDERIYRFAKERIDWIRVYRKKYLRAKEGRREVRQLSEAELKQQKLLLSCPNLMVSLPIDAPSTASMAKALRRQKTLFGMHKVYQDADAAAYLLSFDHLYSQMEQSVFFFLVADDSCSKESIRAVSDVVQQYRFTPIQPFFPIEVQEDSRKIEQIITANPAYLLLLPDHMARTLDTPTVSFEELSLRNIFYRELLADA